MICDTDLKCPKLSSTHSLASPGRPEVTTDLPLIQYLIHTLQSKSVEITKMYTELYRIIGESPDLVQKCAKEVHTSRSAEEAERKGTSAVALQVPFLMS